MAGEGGERSPSTDYGGDVVGYVETFEVFAVAVPYIGFGVHPSHVHVVRTPGSGDITDDLVVGKGAADDQHL